MHLWTGPHYRAPASRVCNRLFSDIVQASLGRDDEVFTDQQKADKPAAFSFSVAVVWFPYS